MPKYKGSEKNIDKNNSWYEVGSDNIFEDLDHSQEEAANLLLRSDLMIEIANIIEERGLSQAEAARILGVKQPRVSELINGRIAKFKVDILVRYLSRLGVGVKFVLESSDRVA